MYNKDGTIQKEYPLFCLNDLTDDLRDVGIKYKHEDWSYQFYNKTGPISEWIRTDEVQPFLEGLFAGLAQTIDRNKIENLFKTIEDISNKNKEALDEKYN